MGRALITGSSNGIGLELADIHAAKGGDLILTARSKARLNDIANKLRDKHKVDVRVIPADLTDQGQVQALLSMIEEEDLRVDVLINNAGFGDLGPFEKSDWYRQKGMIDLNVTALTHLTHALLPAMVDRGYGRILNVASTAAFQPGPYMSVYYATKHYVLSFSEAISSELHGSGVSVTALCPGPTQTGFDNEANMVDAGVFNTPGLKVASARDVAEYGYRSMEQGRTVAIHGMRNKVMATSVRFMPRKAVTSLVKRIQKG